METEGANQLPGSAVIGKVEEQSRTGLGHFKPDSVACDRDGGIVIRRSLGHDRDNCRVLVYGLLEAELRPGFIVPIDDKHSGIPGRTKIDIHLCA